MMKKNKGFTLIELLAVIVILGLLMAIAIPSVTKYITESRKKTLITTVNNYIGALVNEVNDLEYTFTGQNTIYAVPIECIALERGGTNPFGEWYQANDTYFAYVLIQYDDQNSKYVYGFTFKDSAGYGLYPTIQSNIKEKGSQIKTGYDLSKPQTGNLTSLTTLAKWQQSGFEVDSNTEFKVLVSESEGNIGNGETTCTLVQKGKNYDQVEEEKEITKKEEEEKYFNETIAYAIYSESDQSLTFVRSKNEIKVGDVYDDKTVTSVYAGFENNNYSYPSQVPWYSNREKIIEVVINDKIKPVSTALWFSGFENCSSFELANLDTSSVTNMTEMFRSAGENTTTFNLVGLDNWDTSNVTTMSWMFGNVGQNATTWSIGDLSKWDTSSVTNMNHMFSVAGKNATTWTIGDLSNWDTSNVTTMESMFSTTGYNATTWTIGDISNWNTSNVTTMQGTFAGAGYNSTTFKLDLSNWDTSGVTNMSMMFQSAGYNATTFHLVGLDNWDTSKVTNMSTMFWNTGYNTTTWNVGDLSKWNTSSVTNMNSMFENAGYNATYSLDCSSWDVEKGPSHAYFNWGVAGKVISPTWK